MDMVSAYCTVNKGDLPMDIHWTKNGGRLFTNDGIVVTRTSPRISVLNIESVRARHSGNYSCIATNGAVPPQIIPFAFGEEPVNTGENAGLQCMIQKGDIPINIKWTLNSRPIVNGEEGITLLKLSPKTSILNIANVAQHHRGLFKCIAENKAGSAFHTSELKVNVPPQIITFSFGDEALNVGDMFGAQCMASKGDLPLNIHWTLNSQPIVDGKDGFILLRLNPRTSSLNINFLESKHRGVYQCIANNKAGFTIHSADLKSEVSRGRIVTLSLFFSVWLSKLIFRFVPPQISPFDFGEETLNRGEVASVTCMVTKGDLPIDIYWTLNSALIVNGENGFNIMKMNKRTSSLNMESLEAFHRGNYKCIANNSAGFSEYVAVLEVNVPPQIQPFTFGDETANMGEIAGVFCMVPKGDLPLEIRWTLNSAPVINGEHRFTLQRMNPRTSSLSIDSLEAHHRGLYKCLAANKAGVAEYSAELVVNVPPQVLPFSFGEDTADMGEIASVNCVVPKGDLPLEIRWSLNLSPVVNGENNFSVLRLNKRTSSLNIDSLMAVHRGIYKCIASNKAGSSEYTAELQVNVPPQVMPFVFGDEPSNYGDSTAVQCAVFKGDTPLQLRWTLNGQPITDKNAGIRIIQMSTKLSSLSIDAIKGNHRGIFKCIATNEAGITEQSAELKNCALSSLVLVAPQIKPFSFGDDASNSGESVGVQCSITRGDLPINITWILNNQTLRSGDYEIIIGRMSTKASTLNIDYITAEHRGLYKCKAKNQAGEFSYEAELKVNVPPLIHPFSFDSEANEGDSVQLTCHIAKGDLPLKIRWTHNGLPLFSHLGVLTSKIGDRINLLTIESVKAINSGNYSCVAGNKGGQSTYTTELLVNVSQVILRSVVSYSDPQQILPQIIPFNYDDVINTGDSVDLLCQIQKGDRPIKLHWSFEHASDDLHSHSKQPVMRTNRISSKSSILSISSAKREHTGIYTCTAANAAGFTSYSTNLTVNVPPRITPFQFGGEPLNFGEPASIQCTIAGGDWPMSIEWLFNDYHLPAHLQIVTTKFTRHTYVLGVESVTADHVGNYSCVAKNQAGKTSYTTTLIINVAPKIAPFDFGEEPLNQGEPASVQCTILGGDLPINVTWLLNGRIIDRFHDIALARLGKRVNVLTVESVTAHHAGNYSCRAANKAGVTEHLAQLIALNFGEPVSVYCTIPGGDLPVSVIWALNRHPIMPDLDILTERRGQRIHSLMIDAIEAKHAGIYTCIASNLAGKTEHSAELIVNVPPRINPFSFGDEAMSYGEFVNVQCTVSGGDVPLNIYWTLNEKPFDDYLEIFTAKRGKRINELTIESVAAKHIGYYSCVAENRAGRVNHTAELKVNVNPIAQPSNLPECLVTSGDIPSFKSHKIEIMM
uniref:Ig-like domain-containing protein n=1 Tax=Glossina austeni TaxID=7395 RepID=A0A1A9V522_GLOAU